MTVWYISALGLVILIAFMFAGIVRRKVTGDEIRSKLCEHLEIKTPELFQYKGGYYSIRIDSDGKENVKLVRLCDYFSLFSVYEDMIGQISEDSQIFLKGKNKCIAVESPSRLFTDRLVRKLNEKPESAMILTKAWKQLSQYGNMLYLGGLRREVTEFSKDDLDKSLEFLSTFDKTLSPDWKNGIATFRAGFEKNTYVWNWPQDILSIALDLKLSRICFSYFLESPYLNPPVIKFLSELRNSGQLIWIFKKEIPTEFTGRTFDYRFEKGIVKNWTPDLLMSLDWMSEGGFIAAVIPKYGYDREVEDIVSSIPDHDIFKVLLKNAHLFQLLCRRLFDWEASWYSGEYEILSGQDITNVALEKARSIAHDYGATMEKITEPFAVKMFSNDKFIKGI